VLLLLLLQDPPSGLAMVHAVHGKSQLTPPQHNHSIENML